MTRVSVDQDDPGWSLFASLFRVFVNGIERNHVITADEEQRIAICYVIDSRGNYCIDSQTRAFKRETLRGDVAIVWKSIHEDTGITPVPGGS